MFIYPVTGIRILVTDEIVAKLRGSISPADLAQRFGLTVVRPLWHAPEEYVFRLVDPKHSDPLEVANSISTSGLVEWAEPNLVQEYQRSWTPNDPLFLAQWHLNNTGQYGTPPGADARLPRAWDFTTGNPAIVVAVIDDGVDLGHEDLAIFTNPGESPGYGDWDDDGNGFVDDVNGWDFSNNDNDPSPMAASDNHGTAVAGVAAAWGDNAIGVVGSCANCAILPVKVFSGSSFAGATVAADAIRYASSFADVLNNSWGGGAPSSEIQSAIQWATTAGRGGKGSAVLFASGNFAGAFQNYYLTGIPAGTHGFRWLYTKDGTISQGEDTAWLAWAEFPGVGREDFEFGLPGGWTTGGNANWSVVSDRNRADEGFCQSHSAKAGTIGDGQSTYLDAVRFVPGGTMTFRAWVSSEASYDGLRLGFRLNNTGSWTYYHFINGEPLIVTDVAYPAAFPESIAVGASSDLDCRSAYSQYGSALSFVAPSSGGYTDITTTDRMGPFGYNGTENYTSTFSGTSAATPLASGIAALLVAQNYYLTAEQVRQVLQDTADKVGLDPYESGRNDRMGFGRINAGAALASLCTYSIDPASANFGSAGAGGSVSVTSFHGCGWTAVKSVPWITITGGASGTGNGTVSYTVAANSGPARSGTITIGGQTFTVTQASGCTYSIDPTGMTVGWGGGDWNVAVTASAACAWTAVSNDPWITVTAGASGVGIGTVYYLVEANPGPERTGTVTIGGQTLTVVQESGCTYSIDPASTSVGSIGGTGTVAVTTVAGCEWTAVSDRVWITVTGEASGIGNGTFTFSVAPSTSITPRSGTISVGDQSFSVAQAASTFTDLGASLVGFSWGAVAWGDYDNDGDLDILMAGVVPGSGSVAAVYRNDGGLFTDPGATLIGVSYGSVAWGDYDNDGDLDILLTGYSSGTNPVTRIYRNDNGVFADIGAGIAQVGDSVAAWGDFDNDGDLDLLLAGRPNSWSIATKLYRNDGGGVFADSGAVLTGVEAGSVAWGDYDNDGDLDILLCGQADAGIYTTIFRNDGGGSFTDVGAGLTGVRSSSAAWGDYDSDGDLDILVAGYDGGTAFLTRVYRNDGGGIFTNIDAPLPGVSRGSVAWGDYDSDGDLDILLAGLTESGAWMTGVFRNDGSDVFADSAENLPGLAGSAAWGDYNNDGRLDILVVGRSSDSQVNAKLLGNARGPTNTAASAPTGLSALTGTGQVTLGWTASSDAETPVAGLSYNIRLGTTPGGTEITSPMSALGSGYRRVVQLGNANLGTSAIIKGLPAGSYYWSVQAVDSAFAGSAFASEASFTTCGAATLGATVASQPSGGGSGSVGVTAEAGCPWTAASNDPWITVTSGASGSGDGTVGYSVGANAGPARSGTITIAGQTFTVNQASGCTWSIDPASSSVAAGGGTGSVSVTSAAGCGWSATSNDPWITVTSGATGSGNGSAGYSVDANPGAPRSGTITIAGHTFTVNEASGCSWSLDPSNGSIGSPGGSHSFQVLAPAGCGWTAVSNDTWVTVTSGASGSGNGTVGYSVELNTGPIRTGSITVQDQTYTVTQFSGCGWTIDPTADDVGAAGGTGSFNVSSVAGCEWTAASNDSWVTVTSGASGSGNGSVGYSVDANTGPARSGTITAGGRTFTVSQNSGCTFGLAPTSMAFAPDSGQGQVDITASSGGCSWTASTLDLWISIISGEGGTGGGAVTFSVAQNATGTPRNGALSIAGHSFPVSQQARPVITWTNPASITYPTPLGPTQLNASANRAGSFGYSPPSGTILHAGTARPLSVTFTPADPAGYTQEAATVFIDVLQATPVITWSDPAMIAFGTPLSATQLNASASVPGTFVYSPPESTVLPAGTHTLSALFTPTDAENYRTASAAVTLHVGTAPAITLHPAHQTVSAGGVVTFTAAASGDPVPTVQWQISADGGTIWSNIGGATTTAYAFTAGPGDHGRQYRAVFTNALQSACTNHATLTVNSAPSVTTHPSNQTVGHGAVATFTATSSGVPAPTVRWQFAGPRNTWFDIPGATSPSYAFTAMLTDTGRLYRAVFTNALGTAQSFPATLTVVASPAPPVITLHPVSQAVATGGTAVFTVAAVGGPSPAVQWQVGVTGGGNTGPVDGITWSDIPGAVGPTFAFSPAPVESGRFYRAVFTNPSGTATTNAALLTVLPDPLAAPVVTLSPLSQSVADGSVVTFTAAATGNPAPTVQWQAGPVRGVWYNIPGARGLTLSFTVVPGDNGRQYRAVFTNPSGSAMTAMATLTVTGPTGPAPRH